MKITLGYICGPIHYQTVEAGSLAEAKQKVGDSLMLLDDDGLRFTSAEDEKGAEVTE